MMASPLDHIAPLSYKEINELTLASVEKIGVGLKLNRPLDITAAYEIKDQIWI